MSPNDPEKLEASMHRLLRSLPDRKAPAGLEARVLGELSRRASLPWWRRSYACWPTPVRAAFFIGSAMAAALVVFAFMIVLRSPGAAAVAGGVADRFSWLFIVREIALTAEARARVLFGAIPPLWLYGAIGAIATCYAALAAIGAATYRTLTFARQTP
ncbi:MAG TPA: hypothetical protein VKG78_02540 [Opitutaceae bacterium]|nr:hypothetical protein [Opitutaceae bacterium]